MIWWNGAWQPLHSHTFSWDAAHGTEENFEVYNTTGGADWAAPQVSYGSNTCCRIQIHDLSQWRNWGSTIPSLETNIKDIYEAHWTTKYYNWYGHSH
jgi:hypothetical protein